MGRKNQIIYIDIFILKYKSHIFYCRIIIEYDKRNKFLIILISTHTMVCWGKVMSESLVSQWVMSLGLSSCHQFLLLASHSMALTKEGKNPSWITDYRLRNWDFLNFCLVGPHVSPDAYLEVSSFPPSRSICWSQWLINIFGTFGRKEITISLWNVVFAPC